MGAVVFPDRAGEPEPPAIREIHLLRKGAANQSHDFWIHFNTLFVTVLLSSSSVHKWGV